MAISEARLRARRGIKWSHHGPDVLAAWVADMDFDPPPCVVAALQRRLDDGDLGYLFENEDLAPTWADWQRRHHGWEPDPALAQPFTSALHALETVLWNTTQRGDGVVVFTPIYTPFLEAIAGSARRRVEVPLDPVGWRLDPDRLASSIDDGTRLVLVSQPHNPVGRVFDDEELAAIADVAERHDLLVISDEIWSDLTWSRAHRPLALADERFVGRLVTIGSASKSFNLAGMRCAIAHIDHLPLCDRFAEMPPHLLGMSNTLGIAATLAAWREGEAWLATIRAELDARRQQLARRVADDLPGVVMDPPEATYLAWLDFRRTAIVDDPGRHLLERAKVALNPGERFGGDGRGFARLNFATSEEMLDAVVDRIATLLT